MADSISVIWRYNIVVNMFTACVGRSPEPTRSPSSILLPALTAGGQGSDADVELGRRLSRLAIELPDLAEFSGTHDFGVTGSPSTAWAPSRVTADESKLHLMFPDRSTVGALEHSVPCRANEWSEASPFLAARPSHRRLRSVTDAVCGERTRRRADRLRRHHSGDDERSYESPQQARAGPDRRGRDGHLTDIRRNQRRHDDLAK